MATGWGLPEAGMLLWLASEEPQVQTVGTWNAESTDQMIGVDDLLGDRVLERALQFRGSLGTLPARVPGRRWVSAGSAPAGRRG